MHEIWLGHWGWVGGFSAGPTCCPNQQLNIIGHIGVEYFEDPLVLDFLGVHSQGVCFALWNTGGCCHRDFWRSFKAEFLRTTPHTMVHPSLWWQRHWTPEGAQWCTPTFNHTKLHSDGSSRSPSAFPSRKKLLTPMEDINWLVKWKICFHFCPQSPVLGTLCLSGQWPGSYCAAWCHLWETPT